MKPITVNGRTATEWLAEYLKDGAATSSHIFEAARAAGYNPNTLANSRQALGIKIGRDKKTLLWVWQLPAVPPPPKFQHSTSDSRYELSYQLEATGKRIYTATLLAQTAEQAVERLRRHTPGINITVKGSDAPQLASAASEPLATASAARCPF